MQNVVVTGGAGFIGSNLCKELSNKFNVYSIDNYTSGSYENEHDGVVYIKGESKNIDTLLPKDLQVKYVFHLGEYSRVEQSFDDIDDVWEFNNTSMLYIIKYCKSKNAKLIYAGSSTKFGDDGDGRYQSPYSFSKYVNTEFIINYANWFKLNYAIVYFYNVYGKNEISSGKYATVIGLFTKAMFENKPLTVVRPGTQLRNFTYIDDIISALLIVAEKGFGDGYGIGSDEAYSIMELAEMFGGKVKMLPERNGNRKYAEVITQKTKDLGWEPKHKLEDYILQLKHLGWEKK